MAISYTLVQRKDMSRGALEDAKLYYAQAVSTRRVEFDDLCDEIAETCTLTSADIKAVLDRVIWAHGNTPEEQRDSFSSVIWVISASPWAVPDQPHPKNSRATMLRKPKVVFHPGKRLQEMRDVAKFARFTVDKDEGADAGEGV